MGSQCVGSVGTGERACRPGSRSPVQPCAAEATEKAGQDRGAGESLLRAPGSEPQGLDPLGGEKLRS